MLKVTLKEGESLAIGGNITVELKQIATSKRATILIDAPREIPVKRQKAEETPRGAYAAPEADRARRCVAGATADQTGRQTAGPKAGRTGRQISGAETDGMGRQMTRPKAEEAAVCQLAGSGAVK